MRETTANQRGFSNHVLRSNEFTRVRGIEQSLPVLECSRATEGAAEKTTKKVNNRATWRVIVRTFAFHVRDGQLS